MKFGRGKVITVHNQTFEGLVVDCGLSRLVEETLRLNSYLHVMSPRFLLTIKSGFLVVNHDREKHHF